MSKQGFTLVELLVVMGIIMILVTIAVPAANAARNKARDTEVKAGCSQIQAALEQYAIDHGGTYPGAHWEQDTVGNFGVGPGVIGGLPSYDGLNPRQDFYTPKDDNITRGLCGFAAFTNLTAYMADGSPNPEVLDAIVVNGYLEDYPPNPFLKASDAGRAQMANLFLFNPILGDTTPVVGRYDTLDWNRLTNVQAGDSGSDATVTTMRKSYPDLARGHFSYIPLNPSNNTGFDYVAEWTTGNLTDADLSEYYKRCRGYMLIGWGNSRMDDSQAKGISEKYWNVTLNGFDFDNNMVVDPLEAVMSSVTAGSLLGPELLDSSNDRGSFGGANPRGGPDIDAAFFGATFFKVSGS